MDYNNQQRDTGGRIVKNNSGLGNGGVEGLSNDVRSPADYAARRRGRPSANETKEKNNKLIDDILNPSLKEETNKDILEKSFTSPLKEAREHFEREYLVTQLRKNHGNISKTADFIGMERSALHRKLKSLGIKGIN